MKRLRITSAFVAAAFVFAAGAGQTLAEDKGHVVVASWGGSFQDDQRKAIFDPFVKETGIEIIEATGISLSKVRAMVESGNTEWDVSGMVPGDLLVLARDGLVEKLDYENYFKGWLGDIVPEVVHPYGIGNFFYTKVIAFNTEAFPGPERPDSWQDVWNVEKFPARARSTPATGWFRRSSTPCWPTAWPSRISILSTWSAPTRAWRSSARTSPSSPPARPWRPRCWWTAKR